MGPLKLLMSAFFGIALISGLAGVWSGLAFVRTGESISVAILPSWLAPATFLPIDNTFGYFAPQVSYSATVEVRLSGPGTPDGPIDIPSGGLESSQLVSTFLGQASGPTTSALIASSIAEHGFEKYPSARLAEVRVKYRLLPPVGQAKSFDPLWVVRDRYFFERK